MKIKGSSFALRSLAAAALALSCLFIPDNAVRAEGAQQEGWYFTYLYDNSNGLPTSEANAVVQTSIGFIWIGGYSGLTRYDGSEFKHFNSSSGLANVNCLFVDSKDRLWIGTNDGGIALRQNAQFSFWGTEEGLISLSVRAISEDNNGNIIIGTTEGLAYIDSEGELHHQEYSQIDGKYVRTLRADANGVIYGSTMDGCFFTTKDLELTSYYKAEDLGISNVVCIVPDPDESGIVYIGTETSDVIRLDMTDGLGSMQTLSVAPQERVNDIYFASDNKMWVSTNNGMGYFDQSRKFVPLKNSAMTNSLGAISEDREGNIWCASSRQGVMKVVKTPFVDITGISGLDRIVVNTTCIYNDDLYIGTDIGLQLLDKNYSQKTNTLTQLLDGVRIRSIKADSAGNLWVCTYGANTDYGIICYHRDGTYEIFNEKKGMVSSKARTLTELSDGTIAVASSGGVNLIKDGKVTATYNEKCGISNTEILSIVEGDNGSIYFGSDGGGLYILKDGALKCLGLNDGLKSKVIMQLHKDTLRDVYWIVTSNSIAYMKDEEVHTLTNFPYSDNFDMQFDANGGIWVLSSNGIYFVNGDDLISDGELLYSFYDIQSGLPSIATPNSRSYISPDGTLYIAGNAGVSSININTAREGKNNVKLVIPFVEIDGEEIYIREGDDIFVPKETKRLTIHAYAMTYAHNPQVSYYVEGFDDEPIVLAKSEIKPINYTSPHSGNYVFHMSIIDVMTGDTVNSIAVNIIVEKYLYEQPWFWLIIIAATILAARFIIWAYLRNKMAKLAKKEEEDRTFIRQIIQVFAKSIDVKDEYTNGHSFRVAEYTKLIAKRAGYSDAEVEKFYNIGLMHDIGKIMVPNEILNKPGRLTDEEFAIMKTHASNGYDILKEIDIMPELALGAGFHHERMDGRGYPSGKKADEIPEVAQIIAVADTFDAMHSTRPYRTQMKMEDVIAEMKRVSGTQLNEKYVNTLLSLIEDGTIE